MYLCMARDVMILMRATSIMKAIARGGSEMATSKWNSGGSIDQCSQIRITLMRIRIRIRIKVKS
jgi:hypothetical protein